MAGKPKLETVAREAGVSVPTVSQVMRGTGRISDKTRKKVLEAAQRLNYVPDKRAASMRSGQNREIGFAIHQMANPFNAEVINGVSDLLEREGFFVSVLDARDDPERQGKHLEAFIGNGRGGLLWVPALNTPPGTAELLAKNQVPTVTFLRRPPHGQFDHVGIRNVEATARATTYLAQLGHTAIAYLGGTEMTSVRRDRINGYRLALGESGLDTHVVWDCADKKLAGLQAVGELLSAYPQVTGIVCNGDVVALGACLGLMRARLTPGQEVSVVGFDDIADAAVATPPLTTMAVKPYDLGQRLAQVLLDRMSRPELPVTISEVEAKLVVRASAGPPLSQQTAKLLAP